MSAMPADDVVSLMTQDHAAVKQRFSAFESAPPASRVELFWALTEQLVRHEVAEEIVVYPAVRKLPGGDALADERIAEEAEAEEKLAHIEKLDPTTEEFLGAISDLKAAVLGHAQKEESLVFPLLVKHEDDSHLLLLGQKYKGAKLEAPTHPHPHTPNSPAALKMMGPVANFVDRLRDAARST
jgi:iron-sulfur cluster repair protein YtfE (RIC family)